MFKKILDLLHKSSLNLLLRRRTEEEVRKKATYARGLFSLLFIFIAAITVNDAFAQDILILKKNNDQLKVKVLEIGKHEIKFRYWDTPDGPVITMDKKDIRTIKLQGANDKIVDVSDDPMSISNEAIMNKTSAFKYNFFSPLRHHLGFSYEWMHKPGQNWEAGLGIIGPGVGIFDQITKTKASGAFIRFGPKFLLGNTSDYAVDNMKYAHPLKGRYIKIEMILNACTKSYSIDTSGYYYGGGSSTAHYINIRDTYRSMAFNLIYGRQFIVGNSITLGYYVGFGYGFENKTTTMPKLNNYYYLNDYSPNRYSHSYFGDNFPLTTTMGFNIGYIMKTPEWLASKYNRMKNTKEPSRNSMN